MAVDIRDYLTIDMWEIRSMKVCYELENLHRAAEYLLEYASRGLLSENNITDIPSAKVFLKDKLNRRLQENKTDALIKLFQCVYYDVMPFDQSLIKAYGALSDTNSDYLVTFFIRPGSRASEKNKYNEQG